MNSSRVIVALLLLCVVVLGFSQEFRVEDVSGVITSYSTTTGYSTWTSTSHYPYERTSMSTAFKLTTKTALTQDKVGGPYVRIKVECWGYRSGHIWVQLWFEGNVTNLMDVNARKVRIVYLLYNKARTVTEEAICILWDIKPGEMVKVKQGTNLLNEWRQGDAFYEFVRAEIECTGFTTQAPFATYTFSQRFTETHLKTYTSTYTMMSTFSIEEPSPFLNVQAMLALVAVAVLAVAAVIILKMRKSPAAPPPQSDSSKQVCSSCGALIEAGSEFCHNCGKKIE